ncbi:MAG: glycerate-2-kinase family protein, partial [Planctomycetota bacterium]
MGAKSLRADAEAIWRAGVEAVEPKRLLAERVSVDGGWLAFSDLHVRLRDIDRVVVVGGGKAGVPMTQGFEAAVGVSLLREKRIDGLVSVPADCLPERGDLPKTIRLTAGRPAGVNEPRNEGVAAARKMLRLVGGLTDRDLCLCLISGGGSALLPAPIDGITLDQKVAVTRLLSGAGATIDQLNAVRKRLSRIKGGGLARAAAPARVVSLIISDVLGDPLDVIASGPTVDNAQSIADALHVFDELGVVDHPDATPAIKLLRSLQGSTARERPLDPSRVHNLVMANNATAVDAAGTEAERRGYNHAMQCATASEGAAEEVGRSLAAMAQGMRDDPNPAGPDCLITGGEPTVRLAEPAVRGRGGR